MARTEGDTWDLASSVGATATMVAAQRALGHREQLIDDPYAEPLVRAVGLDCSPGCSTATSTSPTSTRRSPRAGPPRAWRCGRGSSTRCSSTPAAAGVRQAVILAAGLDARAYRLPWPDGTVVYEVDQPEVIEFKTTTLAGLGAEPTATHRTVAIDLREDWPKALADTGFDPHASPRRGAPRGC